MVMLFSTSNDLAGDKCWGNFVSWWSIAWIIDLLPRLHYWNYSPYEACSRGLRLRLYFQVMRLLACAANDSFTFFSFCLHHSDASLWRREHPSIWPCEWRLLKESPESLFLAVLAWVPFALLWFLIAVLSTSTELESGSCSLAVTPLVGGRCSLQSLWKTQKRESLQSETQVLLTLFSSL